jgi:acetyl-CoA C-acetyltransferase
VEAVIVATARTPIGRAGKGSLVDVRPDDLSATIVQALLDKTPGVDRGAIEDVIWGCAQPAGEAGYNLARVVAILAGLDQAPGVTVNRYCSSSLQTIRMASHAIRAGEGDIFVAGGVETVSRFGNGSRADGIPGSLRRGRGPRGRARGGRPGPVEPSDRPARHLHRDGPDRRERGRVRQGHA